MKLFVTRRSRSSVVVLPAARCVRPCQHVEASNNLSITTLLPIYYSLLPITEYPLLHINTTLAYQLLPITLGK